MGAIEITMIIFFAIPLLAEYVTDDAAINAFVIICLVLIIIFHLTYYI